MYKLKSAGLAALAGVCLSLAAIPANASEPPTLSGCLHSAKQVRAALDANQQSPNYQAAKQDKRSGFEFCNAGLYRQGVTYYDHALQLLDPPDKKS
jgi:hypothetical protein